LRPQQVFAWRHQATQGRLALPAEELSFVPVVGSATDALAAETLAVPAGIIEVALGGAVALVPPEADGKIPSGWDLHGGWAVRNPTSICVAVPGSRRRYRFSRHRPHGVCR
jgi:hypothetical protein